MIMSVSAKASVIHESVCSSGSDVYILKIEVPLRKRKRDPFLGYCHECVQSKEATPPRYQINYAIGASKRQPTPPPTDCSFLPTKD